MNQFIFYLFLFFTWMLLNSCSQGGPSSVEENDPAFQRGRASLKIGKESEALDEFLSVTRRIMNSPKSHLESGRLFLTLESRKDPFAAIFHFRRFLFFNGESSEASKVEQLIITAEREIIRKLPGEPYSDYLDSLALKEDNDRLKIEIADLRARLGLPVGSVEGIPSVSSPVQKMESPGTPSIVKSETRKPSRVQKHVVQKGDSLYAISRKFYGDSSYIDLIFQANRSSLSSINSLKLGQTLIIPPKP